jgi:hypothetical protein
MKQRALDLSLKDVACRWSSLYSLPFFANRMIAENGGSAKMQRVVLNQ